VRIGSEASIILESAQIIEFLGLSEAEKPTDSMNGGVGVHVATAETKRA
jgi:hypothetical protein